MGAVGAGTAMGLGAQSMPRPTRLEARFLSIFSLIVSESAGICPQRKHVESRVEKAVLASQTTEVRKTRGRQRGQGSRQRTQKEEVAQSQFCSQLRSRMEEIPSFLPALGSCLCLLT